MHQYVPLPDWVPNWALAIALVVVALYALVFLVMPFNVFGVKSRLELIEARLDEIQNEIRHLALRLPAVGGPGVDYEDHYPRAARAAAPERAITRPPIPPAQQDLYRAEERAQRAAPPPPPIAAATSAALDDGREPTLEDRPPPPLNARPTRRTEPLARPAARAEPRMDWRR